MHLYQAQSSPARNGRPTNAAISASSSSTITNFPNLPLNKQQQNPKSRKTLFQHCLRDVAVPRSLQEGVQVLRVFANGKTSRMTMKLSDDKFTLFLNHGLDNEKQAKKWPSLIRKNSTNGNDLDRVIDVGAISEIQRGHSRRRFQLARYVNLKVLVFLYDHLQPLTQVS